MDEIYANVDYGKSVQSRLPVHEAGLSSRGRCHGAAVVCLGLLSVFMVAGLIGLGLHYHNSAHGAAAELSAIKANLTELLQASNDKLASVMQQRDQLNSSLASVMQQRDRMRRLSKQNRTCPAGWRPFRCSCYLASSQSGSWASGREECRKSGADLVVIDSADEQTFLAKFTEQDSWIGLSDKEEEGTWQWIDGSPVTATYWSDPQPDNGNGDPQYGEEDCVHLSPDKWNDRSCEVSLTWVCEKNLHSLGDQR